MGSDMAVSQLWNSLIEVEQCFQNGMLTQARNTNSIVGGCAPPIKNAYVCFKTAEKNAHRSIKTAEPFLPRETLALAECAVNIAVKEFNSLISLSRRTMALPDREKAKRVLAGKQRRSLELFRRSVLPLKQGLPRSFKDKRGEGILFMKKAPEQPSFSARRANPAALNVTLAELVTAIDGSDASVEKKNDLKRTIHDLAADPLVTSLLT